MRSWLSTTSFNHYYSVMSLNLHISHFPQHSGIFSSTCEGCLFSLQICFFCSVLPSIYLNNYFPATLKLLSSICFFPPLTQTSNPPLSSPSLPASLSLSLPSFLSFFSSPASFLQDDIIEMQHNFLLIFFCLLVFFLTFSSPFSLLICIFSSSSPLNFALVIVTSL